MTKILNFALKIKGGGREGGTCEVLRPCHPPQNLERAPAYQNKLFQANTKLITQTSSFRRFKPNKL